MRSSLIGTELINRLVKDYSGKPEACLLSKLIICTGEPLCFLRKAGPLYKPLKAAIKALTLHKITPVFLDGVKEVFTFHHYRLKPYKTRAKQLDKS